jgi:spore germination protein GerM
VVLTVLAIVIVSYYIIRRWTEMKERKPPVGIQRVPEESRSVTLFFASVKADGLVAENREIPVEEGLENQIKAVVGALVEGSEDEEIISPIPAGTEVLRVFWIEETRTVYLDMNRAFVANHPGGSTAEYYTVASIIRTIRENFPQVARLQFLVDGSPVETIAGHYSVDKPLDVNNWR